MQLRPLGRSGLSISPICLGGNVFGWTADEKASFAVLDAFVAGGGNFIDTADTYSRWIPGNKGGESETIIGKWLKSRGNRDKVIIGTKVGMEMTPERKGLSKAHIIASVEQQLKRLQTDVIDLYQSHKDDPDVPLEEPLEVYQELIKAGKVRAIGASNYSATRLRQALDVSARMGLPRYESLQPHYNLYERSGYEAETEAVCRTNEVGVTPYYGLASGFLTGKYRSEADFGKSPRGRGMSRFLNERGLRILAALDEVAAKHKANPAQVALAWLIARPGITSAIASATSSTQVEDLLAAGRLALDAESIALLDQASAG